MPTSSDELSNRADEVQFSVSHDLVRSQVFYPSDMSSHMYILDDRRDGVRRRHNSF